MNGSNRLRFLWIFIVVACLMRSCMTKEDDNNDNVKVEEITSESQRCELGEGPHWDVKRQSLYFVDILAPAILRFDFKTNQIFKATIKDDKSPIGFIVPVEGADDEFVVGAQRNVLLIRWDGKTSEAEKLQVLAEIDASKGGNRINDGKVDPTGVLYFGTMGDESHPDFGKEYEGNFYSFTNQTGARHLKSNIGISNGLTWDTLKSKFYYIDSLTRDVKVFDYEMKKSEISNEQKLIDFKVTHKDIEFAPDGMTIDANGNIYVATWGGSRIIVINPDSGKIIREISIPTDQVTSLAFGGPYLDILFVTTAGKPKPKQAPAGGLFKVTGLNVRGLPMANFKL